MRDVFITKILINKLRHLSDLTILLSENERKHLIITGRNGSGKTSVLDALRECIRNLRTPGKTVNQKEISLYFNTNGGSELQHTPVLHIPSRRELDVYPPQAIEIINLEEHFDIDTDASGDFVQYMVYLNYQKMVAKTENNKAETERIQRWFDRFLDVLRTIYDCPGLELKHLPKELNFKIIMPNREPFGLNEMADGYSALLKIVMELMMRMESKASIAYDMPGIVLIDEIETHLHIELQKKVLPFLTGMFPGIQFIVSTHSPFVISSVKDAVIYDLENQQRLEDLSAYSYEGIVEYYFNLDMYSERIKNQFERYKILAAKENRTPEENDELVENIVYLKQIPPAAASEMIYSFRELERQRKTKAHG
ncbi:MAG: AAA family ATPase [Spirochaetaceae bacterium]|nr:AAA family ATPase [Spirochaetaceae bacterium]